MKAITPEQFVERLQQALPVGLRCVVLYGSAVAGDRVEGRSDYNILVVLDVLGLPELRALAEPTRAWVQAGNHPPLLFTETSLRESADIFPIELRDLQDARRLLFGEDLIATIAVHDSHLRWQIEQELRGKLNQLRMQYLLVAHDRRALAQLLTRSLPKFLILIRATLRLYEPAVPAQKLAALHALAAKTGFEETIFLEINELGGSRHVPPLPELETLCGRYLAALETIIAAVDNLKKGTQQ